jgi:hypothetical protein
MVRQDSGVYHARNILLMVERLQRDDGWAEPGTADASRSHRQIPPDVVAPLRPSDTTG